MPYLRFHEPFSYAAEKKATTTFFVQHFENYVMFIYVNNFQAISAASLMAGINFDIYNVTGGSLRETSTERDYFLL